MIYRLDNNNIWFPDPSLADEDGLLAVGGDLTPERLLLAYSHGIFPWFSDETPILWYSPHDRFVLYPEKVRISNSMKQIIRSNRFRVTFDLNFEEVIKACAAAQRTGQPGTWITDDMIRAYVDLHKKGFAHSIEVWEGDELAGGLYGVTINRVFCGESMFTRVSNASKVALITLCRQLDFRMIDCQMHTPHLESLGAQYISREKYLSILKDEE